MDLWLMTGRPSAVAQSFWWDAEWKSRVDLLFVTGFDALGCDGGGGEEVSEDRLAINVPSRVACRRSRSFSAASCSRLAISSFLLRRTGSSDPGDLLLRLMLIVRMTGGFYIHRLVSMNGRN